MEIYLILLALYMMTGIAMLEWSWIQMKVFREVNEDRDSQYPPYRRLDVRNWQKWKFYFGAMTLLPIRLLLCTIILIILFLFIKLITIGHSFSDGKPLSGCRKPIIKFAYQSASTLVVFITGTRTGKIIKNDYSYEAYLGPNYKSDPQPNHMPTFVCNHTSWMDVMMLIIHYAPAFAAKKSLRKVPVFGVLCQYLGCIFISRGATEDQRNRIIDQIEERQQAIEYLGQYPPLCIFPEGGTTNGRYIVNLKKGAFIADRCVQPVVLDYQYDMFSPAWDITPLLPLVFLQFSLIISSTCNLIELPPFQPNEYLYTKHADKGKEKWEIFAWAVRAAMADAANMMVSDQPLREKMKYEEVLGFRTPAKKEATEAQPLLQQQRQEQA
ncbi:acyltransferase family protein [Stylonychia lemnae]|uniref:Acyltransferase family protein n=1 Tax=Stylonychia lemnae TaxID=5949 RepID=A0A078ALH7_STYLE|nr:acyltransferase family protein [Stylonychia lemnae]|eukprot:CDW83074.1 acyltransferase family protein [Stylonychia lemnae]